MNKLTIDDLLKAVDYQSYSLVEGLDQEIESVEFDSRKIIAKSLFVPLVGGSRDGHEYVQMAIENGANVCFWSNSEETAPKGRIHVIYVKDTLKAMQELASYYRQLVDPIVIAITGSNGKTTSKDMTAMSLTSKYQVYKTQGNYNNEIGMPYTILQMPSSTQVLVLEMGMNHFGEIHRLSCIAQIDVAIITLIGESHIEYLGSRQGIAQAKMEILDGLKEEGIFLYPQNEPLIANLLEKQTRKLKSYTFGMDSQADFYAFDIEEDYDRTYFKTNIDGNVLCTIPVMGSYNVTNALIALAVSKLLDVPTEQAIFQLSQFKLTANRLQWLKGKTGAKILNDAYNASPTSMRAVLASLSNINREESGRKIVVLGDILELGDKSCDYHRQLATGLDPESIDKVYLFGHEMAALYEVLTSKFDEENIYYEANSHQKLITALEQEVRPNDIVLLKSSFSVDLLQVVTALTGIETY